MSASSTIEWTDATWNPVTGCDRVSPGCDNCYAERIATRFNRPFLGAVQCHPERLDMPLRWRKPRRVFVNSVSDLFHPVDEVQAMSTEMRRWVDGFGQAWECDAYDHGPFCRLCRPVELSRLNVPCSRCKAKPGQRCRKLNKPRTRIGWVHTARLQAFND